MEAEQEDMNPVGLVLLSQAYTSPIFARSVIVIVKYDDQLGAFGLCINHPLHLTLNDFDEKKWGDFDQVPVFRGGPVAPQNIILTAMDWDESGQRLNWRLGLQLSHIRDLDLRPKLALKAYCGYMNWLPGELEADIRQQHWLPVPLPSKKIFSMPNPYLWDTLMLQFYPLMLPQGQLPHFPSEN